jgi:hypothetical protein
LVRVPYDLCVYRSRIGWHSGIHNNYMKIVTALMAVTGPGGSASPS